MIDKASECSYSTFKTFVSLGISHITNLLVSTAVKVWHWTHYDDNRK